MLLTNGGSAGTHLVYNATDHQLNLAVAREVARDLRAAGGLSDHEVHMLAILGGLPDTNGGGLLRAAAQTASSRLPLTFSVYRDTALSNQGTALGHRLRNSSLTVEEAYADVAALGFDPSTEPIPFHCAEAGCHNRARIMIDQLAHLGVFGSSDTPAVAWALSAPHSQPGQGLSPRFLEDNLPLPGRRRGITQWSYHVAPLVTLEDGRRLVLDPSLSFTRLSGPVELDRWHQAVGTASDLAYRLELEWADALPAHSWTPPGAIPSDQARNKLDRQMLISPLSRSQRSLGVYPARPLPAF